MDRHSSHHRRNRLSRFQKNLMAIAVVLAVLCVVAGAYRVLIHPPEVEQPPADASDPAASSQQVSSVEQTPVNARKENYYTILVSGVDDGNGNSDTNILVGFDAGTGAVHGISIPRDTKARIRGSNQKINAAYGMGGAELMADTVSDMLGVPVDFTVKVDLRGFAKLVDAIGGVDFDVPINMNYDDPLQDLSIHFKKGLQHLNGADALKVVRFRHNNDGTGYGTQDIGRMETQQKFLKAVAKQTLTLSNVDKIGDLAKIFNQYVDTDLKLNELAWLGQEAIRMGAENISFSTLPGEWTSPYIYLDPEATLEMVNTCVNPYEEPRTLEDLNLAS